MKIFICIIAKNMCIITKSRCMLLLRNPFFLLICSLHVAPRFLCLWQRLLICSPHVALFLSHKWVGYYLFLFLKWVEYCQIYMHIVLKKEWIVFERRESEWVAFTRGKGMMNITKWSSLSLVTFITQSSRWLGRDTMEFHFDCYSQHKFIVSTSINFIYCVCFLHVAVIVKIVSYLV